MDKAITGRRLTGLAAAATVAVTGVLAMPMPVSAHKLGQNPVPFNATGAPVGVTEGADGNLWYVNQKTGQILRMDSQGGNIKFKTPPNAQGFSQFTHDATGHVWYSTTAAITELDAQGTVLAQYTPNGQAGGLTFDTHGNLWYGTTSGTHLYEIEPSSGSMKSFDIPAGSSSIASNVHTMVRDGNGDLWFSDAFNGRVVRVHPADGSMTSVQLAAVSNAVYGLAVGPDGAVYAAEVARNMLARVDPASSPLTPTYLPVCCGPLAVVGGPDNNLWVAAHTTVQVITTTGQRVASYATGNAQDVTTFQPTGSGTRPGAGSQTVWAADSTGYLTRITPPRLDFSVGGQPRAVAQGGGTLIHYYDQASQQIVPVLADGQPAVILYSNGTQQPIPPISAPGFGQFALGSVNGATYLWYSWSGGISRINNVGGVVGQPYAASGALGLAVDDNGHVWYGTGGNQHLVELDGASGAVLHDYTIPGGRTTTNSAVYQIAWDHTDLWLSDSDNGRVVRVDPTSGAMTPIDLDIAYSGPYGIAVGHDHAIYTVEGARNEVARIAPDTLDVSYAAVCCGPTAITSGSDENLWIASQDSVISLAPGNGGGVLADYPAGNAVGVMTFQLPSGDETVWVADLTGSLIRFAPAFS
jgi:streptogramin lyase